MIETFAGLHLRRLGGWIAVADLIAVLAPAGVGGPAVRQALVRIKARGLLAAQSRGGVAGYLLTGAGAADLARGDGRIFRYGAFDADVSAGWVLAVFSVPETDRAARHRLRAELTWLGFGTVGPGVWVAPANLAAPAREQLRDADLDRFVTWFTGHGPDPAPVAQWWDLAGLAAMYRDFLGDWETGGRVDPDSPAVRPATDGRVFADHLHLVDHWRQFPRLDPGLPIGLLPADWPGAAAWRVFSSLHTRWSTPATRYVDTVVRPTPPAG
nr:PaaX family transcriptional regulator C-terminal domain-containing protein [Nakamurella flavida]